jgi:hypothetical protein
MTIPEDPEELIVILKDQLIPKMTEKETEAMNAYFKLDELKKVGYENTQKFIKRMILKYLMISQQ